jgi:hypothetical protein
MQHWPVWVGNLNLVIYLAVHIALPLRGIYSLRRCQGGGGEYSGHNLIFKKFNKITEFIFKIWVGQFISR